jgi:uncharacterized protein
MVNTSTTRKSQVLIVVRVLFFYVCSLVVLLFTSRLTKNLSVDIADLLSIVLASILTFLLVYLFTHVEKLSLYEVGVVPGKNSIQRFFAGYIIGLFMAVLQPVIALGFGHLRFVFLPGTTALQIIIPFLLYFFVACREELVFRSYFLRRLDYSFPSPFALLVMVVVFIAEHVLAGMEWKMAVIGSGLGGLLFGVAALKTRGLALAIGLHSAWNFGQWMVGFKNKGGVWSAVVEKGYERETENISLAAFALVMLLAITGVLLFYRAKTVQSDEVVAARTLRNST